MMMGFLTASIWMFWNVTPETEPNPPCHVLILTPLSECISVVLCTVMLVTHALEFSFPRLPMLENNQKSERAKRREN